MVVITLALMILVSGCRAYIMVKSVPPQKINTIDKIGEKYFIIHAASSVYEIVKPVVKDDKLSGEITWPTAAIHYYIDRSKKYTNSEVSIFNEVHLYLNSKYTSLDLGQLNIPVQDVAQVRLIKKDGSGTIAAIVAPVVLLALLVVAASPIEFTLPLGPL